jgi:hypothetical protein
MADNVIPFKPKGAAPEDDDRERHEEIEAFNALIAQGKATRPSKTDDPSDKTIDKLMDKLGDLTWQIIRCRAVNAYQLEYKLEILREMTGFSMRVIEPCSNLSAAT